MLGRPRPGPLLGRPVRLGAASQPWRAVDPTWAQCDQPVRAARERGSSHFAVVLGGGPLGAGDRLPAGGGCRCVVAIGLLAADLAGTHRIAALTLIVLNPLVLLYVVFRGAPGRACSVRCCSVRWSRYVAEIRRWASSSPARARGRESAPPPDRGSSRSSSGQRRAFQANHGLGGTLLAIRQSRVAACARADNARARTVGAGAPALNTPALG